VRFAPPMAHGAPVGAVFLVWWGAGRGFTAQDVRLIEGVAAQVGLAMENAELARQTRLRLEETAALLAELSVRHEISRTVTGKLHQEDVVEAIQRQVARLLDIRNMILAVTDEATGDLVPLLLLRDGARVLNPPPLSSAERRGLASLVAESGRSIRTDDYLGECRRRGVEAGQSPVPMRHWIGVPMLGRAQLLLQKVEDPTARQWLQIIERSAADGARTVRRLQEFTRIRRDQPAVAVDLNQVVRDALEITEASWRLEPPRRGIHVQVVSKLEPDLPTTIGDPSELREVMTNLILNAVDAMPRGGTLTLATAKRN